MYTTCIFCQQTLGANEAIEHFSVGRRLAYDAAKGRLWVVCTACRRWNLTPLEERWEAIEDAERLFRATKLRASTDNIGMAKLGDGTELVRIGAPQAHELAVWRYLPIFRKRYLTAQVVGGVAGAGSLLLKGNVFVTQAAKLAPVLLPVAGAVIAGSVIWKHWDTRRIRTRIGLSDGRIVRLRRQDADNTRIVVRRDDSWTIELRHAPRDATWRHRLFGGDKLPADLADVAPHEALRVAAFVLPHTNRAGGRERDVRIAVDELSMRPDPDVLFRDFTRQLSGAARLDPSRATAPLSALSTHRRLALEIAAQHEFERRAMEGELALLEAAWREAEEVAKIADDMFLPEEVRSRIERGDG